MSMNKPPHTWFKRRPTRLSQGRTRAAVPAIDPQLHADTPVGAALLKLLQRGQRDLLFFSLATLVLFW